MIGIVAHPLSRGDHWLGNQGFSPPTASDVPIHAYPGTCAAIEGTTGLSGTRPWSNGPTRRRHTEIVPPNHDIGHGFEIPPGDASPRMQSSLRHRLLSPSDIRRGARRRRLLRRRRADGSPHRHNMDDGSYPGTFETLDKVVETSKTTIWLPAHGDTSAPASSPGIEISWASGILRRGGGETEHPARGRARLRPEGPARPPAPPRPRAGTAPANT